MNFTEGAKRSDVKNSEITVIDARVGSRCVNLGDAGVYGPVQDVVSILSKVETEGERDKHLRLQQLLVC